MKKKKNTKYIIAGIVFVFVIVLLVRGCKKEDNNVHNVPSETEETQIHFLQEESVSEEETLLTETESTQEAEDTNDTKEVSTESNSEDFQPEEDAIIPPVNPQIKEQWLFYNSKVNSPLTVDDKKKFDELVATWIKKEIDDNALGNSFASYITQLDGVTFSSAGAISEQKCIYNSLSSIPDYQSALDSSYCMYEFIGLYTKGEYDEYGNLICYYWTASAR